MKKTGGMNARSVILVFTIAFSTCLLLVGCGSTVVQSNSALHTPEPTLLATPQPSPTPTATPVPTPKPTPLPTPLPKELYPTEKELLAGVAQADLFGFLPESGQEVRDKYYPDGTKDANAVVEQYFAEEIEQDRLRANSGMELVLITVPIKLNNDGYDDYISWWTNSYWYWVKYGTTMTILLSDGNGGYTDQWFYFAFLPGSTDWADESERGSTTRIDVMEEMVNGVRLLRLVTPTWHHEFYQYDDKDIGSRDFIFGFRYTYFYYDLAEQSLEICDIGSSPELSPEQRMTFGD